MSLADMEMSQIAAQPGQNLIRVLVYFTDGLMNASQDYFHCGGKNNNTLTLVNYGGYDVSVGMMLTSLILPAAQLRTGATVARMNPDIRAGGPLAPTAARASTTMPPATSAKMQTETM